MQDAMDQWTKMMEKMWSPWKSMMTDFPWPVKPDMNFQGKWSNWFGALRSGYEMNVTWWRTFLDQSEQMFFKAFKDSPLRTDALEQQMRDLWASAKKAQHAQQDTVKEQMLKMENLMKDKEEGK